MTQGISGLPPATARHRPPGELISAWWVFAAFLPLAAAGASAWVLDGMIDDDPFPAQMAVLGLGMFGAGAAWWRAFRPAIQTLQSHLRQSVVVAGEVAAVERGRRNHPTAVEVRFAVAAGAPRVEQLVWPSPRAEVGQPVIVRYDAADPTWVVLDGDASADPKSIWIFPAIPLGSGAVFVVGGLLLML